MKEGLLTTLDTFELYPHPDNPRKNIGDIAELTESVRKNGIMQNLTAIEGHFEGDEWDTTGYTVLIGHRRLAAAKAAGVLKVPVRVVFDVDHKEQVGIMLEENMHRSDLTPIEQAEGFQMMIDLGETEETIAKKTGFSRTTVRHRLQIAKLNKKTITEKQEDPCFQLSIMDLYELEKIKSVKERNKILKEARDSRDLRYKIDLRLQEVKREENIKTYQDKLEKMGITKATKFVIENRYSTRFEQIDSLDADKEPKEPFRVKHFTGDEEFWYILPQGTWERFIHIYRKARKKGPEEKSEWEMKREAQEKKRRELLKIMKRLKDQRKTFVKGIVAGRYGNPVGEKTYVYDCLIRAAVALNTRCYAEHIGEWLTGKRYYAQSEEQKEEARTFEASLSELHRLLVLVDYAAAGRDIMSYNGKQYKDVAQSIQAYHEALELWGFRIDDEEIESILKGPAASSGEGRECICAMSNCLY